MSDNKKKSKKRYFMPPLIIVVSLAIMFALVASRKKPKRQHKEFTGVLVEVMEARLQSKNIPILSHGTVTPEHQVTLVPQVSGKVDWVSPDFVSGKSFSKGDTLLRIEQIDYELAVQQAEAAVAQAEYSQAVAKANADIALREWEIMRKSQGDGFIGSGIKEKPDALVLHEPQLKQSEATLASARASLERAILNLNRTVLTAPFDCRIKSESVDPGQYVSQSTQLAILYSIDKVEIEVGLNQNDVPWLKIPGSSAEVSININGQDYSWPGKVDRSVGVLDEMGRLVPVVIQVKNPFTRLSEDQPELSLGTFVEVAITGREIRNIIALPRKAIHENNTVWISNDETLEIREVNVLRYTPTEALINEGVKPGEKVILTSVTAAANGLKLRSELVEDY